MSIRTLLSLTTTLNSSVEAQLNGTSLWTIISPGWISEPNSGRNTMDIIWTCLVTIFACSWTVTHPPVPRPDDWTMSKVWMCVVAVYAPEMLAMMAAIEYVLAKHSVTAINKTSKDRWSMSQMFFVSMGGVELEFEDFTETLGGSPNNNFDREEALAFLQRAIQLNIVTFDAISVEKTKKRARTNYLVKALVCLQASWLVAQVIGRAVAKLPITTLEVATVGYVVCALITYAFWWHKPQDAEVPITINCRSLKGAVFHERIKLVETEPKGVKWWESALIGLIMGSFGAIHCTAWNFFFSTSAEGVTWKVASILTVVVPPCFYAYVYKNDGIPDWVRWILLATPILYVPVRRFPVCTRRHFLHRQLVELDPARLDKISPIIGGDVTSHLISLGMGGYYLKSGKFKRVHALPFKYVQELFDGGLGNVLAAASVSLYLEQGVYGLEEGRNVIFDSYIYININSSTH